MVEFGEGWLHRRNAPVRRLLTQRGGIGVQALVPCDQRHECGLVTEFHRTLAGEPQIERALVVNERQRLALSQEETLDGVDPGTVFDARHQQRQVLAIDRWLAAPGGVGLP